MLPGQNNKMVVALQTLHDCLKPLFENIRKEKPNPDLDIIELHYDKAWPYKVEDIHIIFREQDGI